MTPTEKKIEDLKAQIAALEAQADAEALQNASGSWADGAYAITNGRGAVVVKARQISENETSFVANATPPLRVRAEMSKDHPAYEARVQTIADALLRCISTEAGVNFEIPKTSSGSQTMPCAPVIAEAVAEARANHRSFVTSRTAPAEAVTKIVLPQDWTNPVVPFHDLLRKALVLRDLTASELATLLDVHPTTVGRWLRGDSRPAVAFAEDLADLMGRDLAYVRAHCVALGRRAKG